VKANIEIVLDGNMRLPASCKCDTLKDVATLGSRITAMARNAKRLLPDLANTGVKSVTVKLAEK
jgi:hypothetical protein